MNRDPKFSVSWGYALAMSLSGAALALRAISVTAMDQPAMLVLVFPIVVSAYVSGGGAALLATVLVGIGSAVYPPHYLEGLQQWTQWLSLWSVGFVIALLAWSRGRRDHRVLSQYRMAEQTQGAQKKERATHEGEDPAAEHEREDQVFKLVTERSVVPFCIIDPDEGLRISYVNSAAVKHFGYPEEEILQMRVSDFDVDFRPENVETIARELDEKGTVVLESVHRIAGGRLVPIEASLSRFSHAGKREIAAWFTDISRRKQGEESLKASEDALRNVFNSIGDAIAIHDGEGRILDVNHRFMSMFSVGPEHAGGRNLLEFCRLADPTVEAAYVWARAIRGEAQLLDWESTRLRDDQRDLLQVFIRHASWNGQDVIVAQIRDVTASRRAEQNLREREASLRLLSDTSDRLLRSEDPERILQEIFDEVAMHVGADVFLNYLVSDDGSHLRLNASRGLSKDDVASAGTLQFGEALCGRSAQLRERIIVSKVQESSDNICSLAQKVGLRAYACHPLIADSLLGTISFGARQRDAFSDRQLEIMRAVADQASMALAKQRLHAELARRAADLDEANQAKDHFLAVLSHELRTPLTPVLASADLLLEDKELPARFREDIELIVRNTDLEARLIDDLLDVTRIARGKVQLHRRTLDLRDVLERAIEVCRPDLEARGLHLDVSICRERSFAVLADAARLQQVFWNLLKNAVKFTPSAGDIWVECHTTDGHVVVRVRDTGEGIEPAVLPHIFDAFEQAGRTRQFGGLGLGLTISRGLVEMHGGTITADSAGPGQGATFTVTLPLQPQVASRPSSAPPAKATEPQRTPLRILLVEDHGDTAHVMKRLLALDGHTVQIAGDVAGAIRLSANQPFDLLISDLGLPDGSGMEIVRAMRERGIQIPAVALSGFGQDEDIRRCQEAGFTTHLTKPVDVGRLKQTIQDVTS